jgi:predicted nucleic acid-binding protein
MSNQDLAKSVNIFMLSNAPTLTEATPLAYELLKTLARMLVFKVQTTKEHACYVMMKKYGHLYAQATVQTIIDEGIGDELSQKIEERKRKRERMRAMAFQPVLLSA